MNHVLDHATRLRRSIPSQFRGPILDALIGAVAASIQAVEDDQYDLWASGSLSIATGALLDQWGAMVGELRAGLADDDFRSFIEARVLLNLTDANAPDVLTLARVLTAPSAVRLYQYDGYGYQVLIVRDGFMGERRAARVGRFLRACKPAGVALDITEQRPGDFGFLGFGGGFGVAPLARAL